MPSTEFFLLAGAHLLALASPGPDFLLLARSSLRHGRPNGMGVAMGITLANGLYIALALAGLSLLQRQPLLLGAMKWLAAAWLARLGWLFVRAAAPMALADTGRARQRDGLGRGLVAGFLSAALNPKNGLFYFGLFALMVSAQTGLSLKLLYGAWMCAVVLGWDAALVLMLSRPAVAVRLGRVLPVLERGAGILLMGAAVTLALARL